MKTLQERIKEVCDDYGNEFITFDNNYSGRGMYGSRCIGIVGTPGDCQNIIGKVIMNYSMELSSTAKKAMLDEYPTTIDDLADLENEFDKAVASLLNYSQDSMGMSGVIKYWPHLKPIP